MGRRSLTAWSAQLSSLVLFGFLGSRTAQAYAPPVRADDYSRLQRFDDVDATGDEAMFVGFLERIEQLPDVVARRRRSYELLALQPHDRVADVGCGLGTAARELAALGARVIGLDASEAMVAEARRRSDAGSVEFAIADVSALPLEDAALAGYRAERLYQHLADPGAALAEAWRVLAPDGTGFVDVAVHPETVAITSPEQGERLPKLAADAAVEAGAVDATVAARWLDDQRARLEAGTFFAAMTHFIAVGRRAS